MQFLRSVLPLAALISSAIGQVHNTSREFKLKTVLSPGQSSKSSFNNLWLNVYHTGAGFNDVVLTSNSSDTIVGFLNATGTVAHGKNFSSMIFDFGNPFPWAMVMNPSVAYAAWQPTVINAGGGGKATSVNGFFINSEGLQWTSTPSNPGGSGDTFGGWLVCDWWHLAPQLFFAIPFYDPFKVSPGCARVQLHPVYI